LVGKRFGSGERCFGTDFRAEARDVGTMVCDCNFLTFEGVVKLRTLRGRFRECRGCGLKLPSDLIGMLLRT